MRARLKEAAATLGHSAARNAARAIWRELEAETRA